MGISIKAAVKEITPPVLMRVANSVRRKAGLKGSGAGEHGEKGPEWYDAAFENNPEWREHYTAVDYYFLWTVIADRMIREDIKRVLDIGCGAGQLACLIRDKGVKEYHGVDFSEKRVAQAREMCPEYQFTVEDIFETDLLKTLDYDAVICTEVLEHVERDLDIVDRIKTGTRFYGTVPNFPYVSHVRHFESEEAVLQRYRGCFKDLRIDGFLANVDGKRFYLMEGTVA